MSTSTRAYNNGASRRIGDGNVDPTNGRLRILPELAPADYIDPVVEAYKKDVDRTLLRENLKLTVEQRLLKAQAMHESVTRWRGVAQPESTRTPTETFP